MRLAIEFQREFWKSLTKVIVVNVLSMQNFYFPRIFLCVLLSHISKLCELTNKFRAPALILTLRLDEKGKGTIGQHTWVIQLDNLQEVTRL